MTGCCNPAIQVPSGQDRRAQEKQTEWCLEPLRHAEESKRRADKQRQDRKQASEEQPPTVRHWAYMPGSGTAGKIAYFGSNRL
jgi:hypothetical protein